MAGQVKDIWLQNAGWIWVPLVVILSILAIVLLRSVPVTANFKTQFSIFKSKHTWFMTLFYYGTFATFAGLGAHFALMGDGVFNHIEGAPRPSPSRGSDLLSALLPVWEQARSRTRSVADA